MILIILFGGITGLFLVGADTHPVTCERMVPLALRPFGGGQ